MAAQGPTDPASVLVAIRARVAAQRFRVSQHAAAEMVEDALTLDDVLHVLGNAVLLENYPDHRRGPCCLVGGTTATSRPVHVVCTSANPVLIIITVYEPTPPKWLSPTQRRSGP